MSDRILLANIERLLKTKKVSADAISRDAKKPDAIRNLRRRVEGEKQGSWTLDTLAAVADALEVSPWELLRPPGALPQDDGLRDLVRDLVGEELAARENPPVPARKRKIR